jgi:hypothetical protein
MKAINITPKNMSNGNTIDFEQPLSLSEIRVHLKARVLDGYTLVNWGMPLHTMLIIEQPLRKNTAINSVATQLYRANSKPDARRQIRGAVMIVPDEDFTYQLPLD